MPKEYEGLGGRGLTSAIVAREVDPGCTPLGPRNKLVFAPGLLGATNAPNTNRLPSAAKARSLAASRKPMPAASAAAIWPNLGIMAIVVEGMAPGRRMVGSVVVEKDSAWLVKSEVAGLNN